jgi:hypothetical protein
MSVSGEGEKLKGVFTHRFVSEFEGVERWNLLDSSFRRRDGIAYIVGAPVET